MKKRPCGASGYDIMLLDGQSKKVEVLYESQWREFQ